MDRKHINGLKEIPPILREAANIIAALPPEVAEKLQVRYFLADELEGGALCVEELVSDAQKV